MQKWFSLLILLCLFSCTVEKRLYRPGYSVEWKHRKKAVENEAPALRLKEENKQAMAAEKTETGSEKDVIFPIADTIVKSKPAELPTKPDHFPQKSKKPVFQQKAITNIPTDDDPEKEPREPKYANGFMQFLAILLGVILGIVACLFFIVFMVAGGDIPLFDLDNRNSTNYKTFKSVFLAAFRITFILSSTLLILLLLVVVAYFLYVTYGIWALIGAFIGIILLLLLLSFLFGKMFDFVFHDR